MLTRELFHQAESKDQVDSREAQKGFGWPAWQAMLAERGSCSIVYLKDSVRYWLGGETSNRWIDPGNARQGMGRDRATLNYQ